MAGGVPVGVCQLQAPEDLFLLLQRFASLSSVSIGVSVSAFFFYSECQCFFQKLGEEVI